jgi:hypothetical protein
MRQVSAALAAAIEAPERTTRMRLSVDWAGDGHGGTASIDDLSDRAGQVTLSRTLQADVPDEVRTVEGSVVAALDVDLVRGDTDDDRRTAARYFSRFSTGSPLYGLERIGRDVRADVEVLTGDGWQAVPRMRGQVREMPVAAGQMQASLRAIDYRDRLRTKVTLPAVIATAGQTSQFATDRWQAPGLEPSWVVSFVLAQNGVYVSPPPRPGCRIWIPFHGSAFPMIADLIIGVGQVDWTDTGAGTTHLPITFSPGPYLLGMDPTPTGHSFLLTTTSTRNADAERRFVATDGQAQGRIEFWARTAANASSNPISLQIYTPFHGGQMSITYSLQAGTSKLQLAIDDQVSPRTINGPAAAATHDGDWHFFGLWLDTAAGTAVFRVDDVDTTVAFTPMTPNAWTTSDEAYDLFLDAAEGTGFAELQITGGTAQTDPWLNDTAAYTWSPGAVIDRSTVPLQGIAIADPVDSWQVLDDLAAACLGAVWYDEDGLLQWATSARLVGAAGQSVQRTVTSAADIVDLAYTDRADTVRNRIRVPYSPIVLHAAAVMWTADTGIMIPAGGRVVIFVAFDGQFVTAPATLTLAANTAPDGSGTDVSAYVNPTAGVPVLPTSRTAIYTLTNNYWATVWLVDATGAPALTARGDWIEQTTGAIPPDLADSTVTAGTVAERPLQLDANPWVQDRSHAAGLAMALLCQLRDPQQPITQLEIPADPRLQFYDRIRVQDTHQTMLDGAYWVTGIDETHDGAAYMQQLSARQARDRYLVGTGLIGVDLVG